METEAGVSSIGQEAAEKGGGVRGSRVKSSNKSVLACLYRTGTFHSLRMSAAVRRRCCRRILGLQEAGVTRLVGCSSAELELGLGPGSAVVGWCRSRLRRFFGITCFRVCDDAGLLALWLRGCSLLGMPENTVFSNDSLV